MGDNETQQTEKSDFFTFLKKNWNWILIIALVILGFYLRVYHLDYPVIGYHNWKETHYLTEARNFAKDGFFAHGFFVPYTDYPIVNQTIGVHPDTFPLPQIIIAILFKLFGIKLWLARLVSVLFSIATIPFFYLFARHLFKREDFAITSAFLFAINPLFVFFGRAVQLDSAALFFMITSGYFFLRWNESDKNKDLILTSIFLTLATLTKYTFFVIGVPMLLLSLSRLKEWKQRIKPFMIAGSIMLLVPLWMLYMNTIPGEYGLKEALSGKTVRFDMLVSSEFWQTMKSYAADNYTLIGVLFAAIGFAFLLFHFRKSTGHKFVTYYFVGAIIWFLVMSFKLSGHSYHQYPIAPLIILLIAYFFTVISITVQSLVKLRFSKIIVFAVVLFIIWGPSIEAKDRQFDTQFFGLDVAGEYINQHSENTDKILQSSHQSYGIHWHADREGFPIPSTLEKIKNREEQGVTWIFLYQWSFDLMKDPERWNYIKDNYGLKQIAFIQRDDKNQPIYLLFKKGGRFNESELNELVQNKEIKKKEYELTGGSVTMSYIDID